MSGKSSTSYFVALRAITLQSLGRNPYELLHRSTSHCSLELKSEALRDILFSWHSFWFHSCTLRESYEASMLEIILSIASCLSPKTTKNHNNFFCFSTWSTIRKAFTLHCEDVAILNKNKKFHFSSCFIMFLQFLIVQVTVDLGTRICLGHF